MAHHPDTMNMEMVDPDRKVQYVPKEADFKNVLT